MTSKRLYFGLIGIICLLLMGMVVGAYEINTLLGKRSDTLINLKAKSQALDQEQLLLVKDKKDLQTYASLGQIAKSVVPQDKNQAEAVLEIVNIAASNGIAISSVTFPASTLGSSSVSGATVAPTTTTVTPSPAQTYKAGALSQLVPVKNIPGVYLLSIAVESDTTKPVPYDKFINFLSALEHNRRTSQISGISLTPDPKDPNQLSFSLNLNEYIKP